MLEYVLIDETLQNSAVREEAISMGYQCVKAAANECARSGGPYRRLCKLMNALTRYMRSDGLICF